MNGSEFQLENNFGSVLEWYKYKERDGCRLGQWGRLQGARVYWHLVGGSVKWQFHSCNCVPFYTFMLMQCRVRHVYGTCIFFALYIICHVLICHAHVSVLWPCNIDAIYPYIPISIIFFEICLDTQICCYQQQYILVLSK